jgi:hypothetical protein
VFIVLRELKLLLFVYILIILFIKGLSFLFCSGKLLFIFLRKKLKKDGHQQKIKQRKAGREGRKQLRMR